MYNQSFYLSPSILSADFSNLNKAINLIESTGADWIHLDVMDGQFVPPITFGEKMVFDISKITQLPLDVHLMINNPEHKILDFIKAGAQFITIHQESTIHLHRLLCTINDQGAYAGISIIPSTPVEVLYPILSLCKQVLVMSVNPGYSGQKFIDSAISKIEKLVNFRKNNQLDFIISLDGGVNLDNVKFLKDKGVDNFIAGSAFFGSDNPQKLVNLVKGVD